MSEFEALREPAFDIAGVAADCPVGAPLIFRGGSFGVSFFTSITMYIRYDYCRMGIPENCCVRIQCLANDETGFWGRRGGSAKHVVHKSWHHVAYSWEDAK